MTLTESIRTIASRPIPRQYLDGTAARRRGPRVHVLVRPAPHAVDRDTGRSLSAVDLSDDRRLEVMKGREKHIFSFDHVCAPGERNAAVAPSLLEMCERVLGGHSVCIAAYGESGTGKTYTMVCPAPRHGPPHRGCIRSPSRACGLSICGGGGQGRALSFAQQLSISCAGGGGGGVWLQRRVWPVAHPDWSALGTVHGLASHKRSCGLAGFDP